jgi:Spy/CpxP family protein refolding chaperone
MKRFTLSVVLTGVLGLAAYTLSGAQPPGRGPGGPLPGGGPGFGRGELSLLRDANLTDAQKAEIRSIRDAERDARQGEPADFSLRRQLQTEVFADSPDAQKIAALQQQIVQAEAARISRQIAVEQKVAQVLTAEQRAAIRERLAQAPEARGRARGGREARDDNPDRAERRP